jgi:peptidoglycan LD-endopeptidase CwlK
LIAEREAVYAKGGARPGPKVTNAHAKDSRHSDTLPDGRPGATAFDVAVFVNGVADWNIKNPAWAAAGKIGESLGLEWGARWTRLPDTPHFQLKQRP